VNENDENGYDIEQMKSAELRTNRKRIQRRYDYSRSKIRTKPKRKKKKKRKKI
jgi:hypothetical protein